MPVTIVQPLFPLKNHPNLLSTTGAVHRDDYERFEYSLNTGMYYALTGCGRLIQFVGTTKKKVTCKNCKRTAYPEERVG